MEELFIRYFHFLGIMVLSSALLAQHLLISRTMAISQFKKLAVLDTVTGLSALFVFIPGLLLWFYVGKPSEFYSSNWVFHAKLTLFVVIAILSIFPTVFILRNRKSEEPNIDIPRYIIIIVRVEIFLLMCIPFLAVLMARGYGLA